MPVSLSEEVLLLYSSPLLAAAAARAPSAPFPRGQVYLLHELQQGKRKLGGVFRSIGYGRARFPFISLHFAPLSMPQDGSRAASRNPILGSRHREIGMATTSRGGEASIAEAPSCVRRSTGER